MRSYAKSIALYERTRKTLAGGVSSNVRYAVGAGAAVLRARRGRAALRRRWQRAYRLRAGQRPGHPGPCAQAGDRCRRRLAGAGPGLCRAASARDRAGGAAVPAAAGHRGGALRDLGHRGGADGVPPRPRLHRPDQDPEIRGPLSRLERPGLYQRAAVAERGGPGRVAGAGRGLARHAAERAGRYRRRRLERPRSAGAGVRAPQGRDRRRHHGAGDGEWRADRARARLSRGRRAISAATTARCSSATRSSPASVPACAARRAATASPPISRSTPRRLPRAFRSPWSAAGAT